MKLFEYFSTPGFHTSISTTFCVDFKAYESIVLPRLKGAGCTNNVLLADERMLTQVLMDESQRPNSAGRSYSVVGVTGPGVFHPKVTVQLGKTAGRLSVASANMTSSGLAGNLEIVGLVQADDKTPDAASLIRAALNYLLTFASPSPIARRQIEWAIHRSPWLPTASESNPTLTLSDGSRIGFLVNDEASGVGRKFQDFVGGRKVNRLVVVSPYWDSNLSALNRLKEQFAPKELDVVIQASTALFPAHALNKANSVQVYDLDKVPNANSSRFAHAKLVIAESEAGDCIMFGSANCTGAALGTLNQRGVNDEACLVRDAPAGLASEWLGLHRERLENATVHTAALPEYTQTESIPLGELSSSSPGRFELAGEVLRWWCLQRPEQQLVTLELFSAQNELLQALDVPAGISANPVAIKVSRELRPSFARYRAGEFTSALGIVLVESSIDSGKRSASSSGAERELEKLLGEDKFEGVWLLEVVQRLAQLEQKEMGSKRETVKRPPVKNEGGAPEVRRLTPGEFTKGADSGLESTTVGVSRVSASSHEHIRGFLNMLLGRASATETIVEPPLIDIDVPSELNGVDGNSAGTGDMAGSPSPSSNPPDTAPASWNTSSTAAATDNKLRETQTQVLDDAKRISTAVETYLVELRKREATQAVDEVDLLRLRLLISIVLWHGTRRAQPLPNQAQLKGARQEVLPSQGEMSWRRLVGRLLFEFFRQHGGAKQPLVQRVPIPPKGEAGYPEDLLECWATCFWAACAVLVAHDGTGKPVPVQAGERQCALDLYRAVDLLPQLLGSEFVSEYMEAFSLRYGNHLGVSGADITREHERIVSEVGSSTNVVSPD